MSHSNAFEPKTFTSEEVDALVGQFGRIAEALRVGLEEADALARAGEVVGYESAFRILRRAVVQVLEDPFSVPRLGLEQRNVLAYLDGYLLGRGPGAEGARARLRAAFPVLGELDDAEARRDA